MDRPAQADSTSDLHAQQVHVLYRNMPTGVLASAANAAILAAVEWSVVPHAPLVAWVLLLWLIAAARAILILQYRRATPAGRARSDWHRWMLISTTAAGVAWGGSVYFLTADIPLPYELVHLFVLGGMTAGAISVLSVSLPLFLCYAMPVTLPVLGHLLFSGQDFHLIMGAMGCLFLLATIHSAWNFNRVLMSSIRLQLEKVSLVQSLTIRTEAVERLNQDITKEIHERRIIEDHLRTAQSDLEQRIAERTTDLAQANARLQEEVREHRLTEGARLSSEKRFNYLTDNLNQGVWFARAQPPQVLYVNPAFERIWGLPAARFYDNPKLWRDCVHPDDQRMVMEVYDAELTSPTGRDMQLLYRIVRPDGKIRWIHDRMVIHRSDTGDIDNLSGITEDITEARELEDQLRQAQKMEAVGRLAGGVAHDFNNVMTVILGYSAVLLQELSQDSSARYFVQEIQRAGERCAALTGQLLAFSRKQMLHPVSLDLHRVIRDLMALLKSLIGEHVTIVLQLDPSPRWVKADAVQLEQVLLNLAVNARDAMPHGGTLTIDTSQVFPKEVWGPNHEARTTRTYVRLRVHDTGTGIDAATKAKIFEPFFTTKPPGRGTGLGLSTVYGIVRQTGGYIFVDSAVGEGAIFRIYLPEHHAEAGASQRLDGKEDPARDLTGIGTILLVEDEDAVRLFSARALRNKGYQVLEARSGEAALEIVGEHLDELDLIISDVVMPRMDGPTMIKEVRSRRADLPVIFISGYAEDAFRRRIDAGEEVNFLLKPFTLKQLAAKVKEVLEVH